MSRLTDFAAAAFTRARSVIGGESLSISGGTAVSCVLNEVAMSRDYESGGFERTDTLDAVVALADWNAAYPLAQNEYFNKPAVARGITFRTGEIRKGQSFVIIRLQSVRKGS